MKISVASAMADIPATDWDICMRDAAMRAGDDADNPFMRHAFLHALEASGSARPSTGWQPLHVLVQDDAGTLVAAAPCYLKGHSQGEYVFDHGWADAYERAGGQYYPKLIVCVPFTPATGPRLLVRAGEGEDAARKALLAGLDALREQTGVSSLHVTFPTHEEWLRLGEAGYLLREDCQYHWQNENYQDFDAFLAALSSRKRKVIRRERKEALAAGITIDWLTGDSITEADWDDFFIFYQDTGSRKWGRPYLTRDFYRRIGQTMADRVLLVMARREGRAIAGAINFIGQETLYGRHWGAIEEHPFLHFEVCYYQAIEYAITHGLQRVEAGAQGEHKLARGYRPVLTKSAHAITDPGFREAIRDWLAHERQAVEESASELAEELPFRTSQA